MIPLRMPVAQSRQSHDGEAHEARNSWRGLLGVNRPIQSIFGVRDQWFYVSRAKSNAKYFLLQKRDTHLGSSD